MDEKRKIYIKKIDKKEDILKKHLKIKKTLNGRRLIYVFEPKDEINLDIKKNLMFSGFFPKIYKNKDIMIKDAEKEPPEMFFISTINKEHNEIIKEIKQNKNISYIFVIGASIYKNSNQIAYDMGAEFYIPMPYVWKRLKYLVKALTFINDLRFDKDSQIDGNVEVNFYALNDILVEIRF